MIHVYINCVLANGEVKDQKIAKNTRRREEGECVCVCVCVCVCACVRVCGKGERCRTTIPGVQSSRKITSALNISETQVSVKEI